MPQKIAVANFKAEFTETESKAWLNQFISQFASKTYPDKEIILCPPYLFLDYFRQVKVQSKLNFKLGSQNLSSYERGTHTGEITASMLKSFVDYVIIGHSEERRISQETIESLQQKIDHAAMAGLKIILCQEQPEPLRGDFFALAYEPASNIGTGESADPAASWQKIQELSSSVQAQNYLYGGSVNSQNVSEFIKAGFNGVLVGKKTLDPKELLAIIEHL